MSIGAIVPLSCAASESLTEIAIKNIDTLGMWIGRIILIIALSGAIRFILSIKRDDNIEQVSALLVIASCFMMCLAFKDSDAGHLLYIKLTNNWLSLITESILRLCAFGTFMGAFMFDQALKKHNAKLKMMSLRSFAVGTVIVCILNILQSFIA